jgi:multiple sugar transport system ATP-binding protein
MRDGRIQQVDVPQRLYEEPTNVFVAAFIGSPAMNLITGSVDGDEVAIGSLRLPLTPERRPATRGRVVVGIRPETFEDAAFAQGDLPQIEVRVEVLEELGADANVFFSLDAERVVVEEALSDDAEEDGTLLTGDDQSLLAARVDPRTRARVGDSLRLAVDPARLYFFSAETGESLSRQAVAA